MYICISQVVYRCACILTLKNLPHTFKFQFVFGLCCSSFEFSYSKWLTMNAKKKCVILSLEKKMLILNRIVDLGESVKL